jgi:peptide/nickel transport system ATP-binding protein
MPSTPDCKSSERTPENAFKPMTATRLKIDNLVTEFVTPDGVVRALDHVSFELKAGQIMGLVGESGSGKSLTGFSIMGLLDAPGRITSGRIVLGGQDIRTMTAEQLRHMRGNRMAMIFQDPMMTLNPVMKISAQMVEAIEAHRRISKSEAINECRAALAMVGIASPDERLEAYPHQLSGGMRQRVAIAIALLNKPDVIIADEPTTALDVTIQGQILAEIQKICRQTDTAVIWITHDLSVVSGLADHISVMYAGKIVEQGTSAQVLGNPAHPYTRGLIRSVPAFNPPHQRLYQIPGMAPALSQLTPACAFQPRCERSCVACAIAPPVTPVSTDHAIRCFHPYREPLEFVG